MDGRGDGIIILSDEIDEAPTDTAAAVRALADQIGRTGDQIGTAAADYFRQISRSAAALSLLGEEADEEPRHGELDTAAAEFQALAEILKAERLANLPEIEQPARALPRKLDALPFPLDKATRELFAHNAGAGFVDTASRKQRAQGVRLLTALSFQFIGEAADKAIKKLSAYDRRVLLTVGGLYLNGCETLTLTQIHAKMGGTAEPNERQRARVWGALVTLCNTWVQADNSRERDTLPDAPKIKLGFHLLEARLGAAEWRGQKVEAVHVLASPQWLQLAEKRGQITRIPFDILADGLSLTEQSIALSDYLIDRIARMNRNPKAERRILIDTAAGRAGVELNTRSARQKLKTKIQKKLAHFSAIGYIDGFTEYGSGAGFTIKPKRG